MESLASRLAEWIGGDESLRGHPCRVQLAVVLGGETSVSSAGYPYVSEAGFRVFVDQVPYLFAEGQRMLDWLAAFEAGVAGAEGFSDEERASMARAVRVARTMVFTAAVTAPPDLWVLRQVLTAYHRAGVIDTLLEGEPASAAEIAARLGLDERQVSIGLHLLVARGYLESADSGFVLSSRPAVADALRRLGELSSGLPADAVTALVETIRGGGSSTSGLEALGEDLPSSTPTGSWIASLTQIEVGYRLLPVVLALHVAGRTGGLAHGEAAELVVGTAWPLLEPVLEAGGLASGGAISELGARVFARGPGPYGIVAAYWPYFDQLEALLEPGETRIWVRRAENVAASQSANRKTFRAANEALDRFSRDFDFDYGVFIEHAVGQGEAVRQRFELDGETTIRYLGADLEDAAIEQAERQQRLGVLPRNMRFLRGADIGDPHKVTEYLEELGLEPYGAVMMVGNGFHEIRDQTRDKMRQVFAAYERAGILLVFTEETALSDQELVSTAWNTYHAGFRFVHELSGQGLRSTWGDGDDERLGWRRLVTEGGYLVLDDYCYRTRTIYPLPRADRRNPAISMSYFCVPARLAGELGVGGAGRGS